MLHIRASHKLLILLTVSICLASCGGGGSSSPSTSTGAGLSQTASVGSAKVSFSGKAVPAISSSSYGVTVQGLSGAAFSFIDFYPQPTLQNTMIMFQRDHALWTYSILTGQVQEITHFNVGYGANGPGYDTWGPNGLILLSVNNVLYQMYADGTHLTPLTTTGVISQQITSWDGTRIAGLGPGGSLMVMSANGSGIKSLVSAAGLSSSGFSCAWFGNSTIGYVDNGNILKSVPASGGSISSDLFSVPNAPNILSGFSDTTTSTMVLLENRYIDSLSWSPGVGANTITPSDDLDTDVSVAPDNNTMAIYRQHSTDATNDGYSGIWSISVTGENPRLLVPDPSGDQNLGIASNIHWSNYPSYRRFVGSGGSVATASAGFLTSEAGPAISSFFTFTAKTPSTATITPATSTGSEAPLVFSVHADSITEVWYKNGYYMPATAVPLSGATDAVVSFDSQYGQISFVAPAIANSSAKDKPRSAIRGSATEYTGHFTAIYDKTGKNLASGTVSTISIDSKSGKLLNWR